MAKGLNRFTNVPVTPPELAFPIRQRQWRSGEIARLRKLIKTSEEELRLLQREVDALDVVIGMHKIKIDPRTLPSVTKQAPRLLPYGALKRGIMNALRSAGGKEMTTVEIALKVAEENSLDTTPERRKKLRIACVKELNYLLRRGDVVRLHAKQTNGDGFWRLAEQ